jgi:hypothetical protein
MPGANLTFSIELSPPDAINPRDCETKSAIRLNTSRVVGFDRENSPPNQLFLHDIVHLAPQEYRQIWMSSTRSEAP